MRTLEIELSDQTAANLQKAAQRLGLTLEQLLQISVEEKFARLDEDFRTAVQYVLHKNAELYKRLS